MTRTAPNGNSTANTGAGDERSSVCEGGGRLLARTATLDFSDVRDLVLRLGCRRTPPSREALATLLTAAADPLSDSDG